MSKLIATTVFVILTVSLLSASDLPLGGMRLIDGYALRRESAVDAAAWRIEKQNGPRIEFESGPSEGSCADPKDMKEYTWYLERIVNRDSVRLELTNQDMSSDEDDNRELSTATALCNLFA